MIEYAILAGVVLVGTIAAGLFFLWRDTPRRRQEVQQSRPAGHAGIEGLECREMVDVGAFRHNVLGRMRRTLIEWVLTSTTSIGRTHNPSMR